MDLSAATTSLFSPLLGLSVQATPVFQGGGILSFFTNSIFLALVVLGLILLFSKSATKNMTLVPHKAQNAFEFFVEFMYNQVEGIVGKKIAPKAFPLLATIFLFIVVSNWLGLVPGVGTIGFGKESVGPMALKHIDSPLLRPATADLNMTLGIALAFMVVWSGILIKDVGIMGFIKHTFGGPGGMNVGLFMRVFLGIVFFVVGIIELVSIIFRPASLSLRLFGNIYAGETLLHVMMNLSKSWGAVGSFLGSVIIPLPFYFMELLVGLLQGVVFALLCAVYIQLLTGGDDHGEEHH